jgi:hypothetical protein
MIASSPSVKRSCTIEEMYSFPDSMLGQKITMTSVVKYEVQLV